MQTKELSTNVKEMNCGNAETTDTTNKWNKRNLELVSLVRSGQKEYATEIIEFNSGFLHKTVNKYHNLWSESDYDYDDVFSLCTRAMLKAIISFDFNAGVLFMSYASTVINNEILMELRKLRSRKEYIHVSFDNVVAESDHGEKIRLRDVYADPNENVDPWIVLKKNSECQLLYEAINSLKKRDRLIVHMYWFEERNQKQIASQLGISQSYVARIINRTLNTMKQYIERKSKE